MHIFLDSADPLEIQQAVDMGFVDGVTTNPSLAAKVGRPYPADLSKNNVLRVAYKCFSILNKYY